ncbi:MAG: MipA/OmpV family protein [Rubrivivax sp.]|nr:MipA/OmpV family protein [Rubrivivax sp.]
MMRILRFGLAPLCAALVGVAVPGAVRGADATTEAPASSPSASGEGVTPPADAPAGAAPDAPPAASGPPWAAWLKDIDGALGASVGYGPEYRGASALGVGWEPVFYLRIGKVSISSGSGFITRRADDVLSGLAVDAYRTERTRLSLSLRADRGRDEGGSDALQGLGDTPDSLRLRAALRHQIAPGWRASLTWSIDALARGKGGLGDISLTRDIGLGPASAVSLTASVSAADRRYMQMNFGVTEAQSQTSGYPVYEPGAGLRDAALSVGVRSQLGERWWGTVGFGVSRLLSPAADSPFTPEPLGWGLSGAMAWGF